MGIKKKAGCPLEVSPAEVEKYHSSILPLAIRWIGNPLDWSLVDKGLLCAILALVFGGMFVVAGAALQQFEEILPYANFEFIHATYPLIAGAWSLLLITTVVGFLIRKRDPENRIFPTIVIYYGTLTVAFYCYSVGTVTHPGLIVGFSGGLLYLLLFDFRTVILPVFIFTIIVVALTLGAMNGYVPYAPLFHEPPYQNGRPEAMYLTSTLGFTIVLMLSMFFLMAYMVGRWRDREKQVAELSGFLKQMFGRYVSSEVMQALLQDPASLQLGGHKRRVTILMTDLRGFTQFSERLDPQEVVRLLNRYYESMVHICREWGGTVNDIIGDALLVTFGAPKTLENHAPAAIACAIEMQNAMATINQANVTEGLPELEMGIGINTAEVVVGSIGSEERAKFGVVGAGVNMASRIESYTVGGQILVSESTREEAGALLRIDGEMEVKPKGTEGVLRIFSVGGIGGTYNLSLENAPDKRHAPSKTLALHYTVLDGKHVAEEATRTKILELSSRSICFSTEEALPPHANIKLNLEGVSPQLARLDIYAKVAAETNNGGTVARFTALPPEIAAYIEALLPMTPRY